ncbi:UNVERIFIED_ORG: transposase [Martelella mediterranea]
MDIHRVFAEAVALEDGETKRLGRIGMTREHLEDFARTLLPSDHVVVEATGNATAVVEILAPRVARVAVANPLQVHLIAKAKIKTDAIDARVLAQLYAAGFLPEVWIPDAATLARRRQVTRRTQLVRQRTRLKSIVQSILHANLIPPCPFADLFGGKGRIWLRTQYLPDDEREAIERHVEEYDRQSDALKGVERDTIDDDPGHRHGGCCRSDGGDRQNLTF